MRYKGLTIVLFAVVTLGFVFGFLNYHKKLDAMLGKEIVQASTGDFNLPPLEVDPEGEEPSDINEDEKIIVPSLTGLTKDEAVIKLEELQFVPVPKEEYSDETVKGEVFSQSPEGEETAASGTEVTFSVSLGKKEGTTQASGQIIVPNVIGWSKEDAEKELKDTGFSVAYEYNPSQHYDEGYVYSQNYKVGARVATGTQVTIRISTGR